MARSDRLPANPGNADLLLSGILGAAAQQLVNMRATGDRVQDLVSGLVATPGADLGRDAMMGLQGLDSLVQQLSLLADLLRELQVVVPGGIAISDPARLLVARGILSRLEGAATNSQPNPAGGDCERLASFGDDEGFNLLKR